MHSACAVEEEFNEKVEAFVRLRPMLVKSPPSVVPGERVGRGEAKPG